MLNKKTLTKNEARALAWLDGLLGLFHAYGAYYFHKNDEMIGFGLTVALVIVYSVLHEWVKMQKEKGAIYKQSNTTFACPMPSSGGARGVCRSPLRALYSFGGI